MCRFGVQTARERERERMDAQLYNFTIDNPEASGCEGGIEIEEEEVEVTGEIGPEADAVEVAAVRDADLSR
jgi:hypothetical protein